MNTEIWKAVPGFPNYEVSSDGRVCRTASGKGARAGQILSPHRNVQTGYWVIDLYHNGQRSKRAVHELVATAFHGPKPSWADCVRHLDGSRDNARASNLVWSTDEENMADRVTHQTTNRGERNGRSHLTLDAVKQIKAAVGKTQRALAEQFGVCRQTISDIQLGRRWGWLT